MSLEWTRSRVDRAEVVAAARRWIDVRFRHQGRSREGIDCGGLLIVLAHELGLSEFDVSRYARRPDGRSLKKICDEQMRRVPFSEAQPGDVILFRIESDPQHLALLGDYQSGGLSIIHAYAPRAVHRVVETRLDDWWRHRIVQAYALPGVG
jgi:cell wall-associated NlpC family hydrolase